MEVNGGSDDSYATTGNHMVRLLLTILFLLSWYTRVGAATYWVSKSGNDANSCGAITSVSQPGNLATGSKLTITSATNCMGSGDKIMIVAGSYNEAISTKLLNNGACQQGTNGGAGPCLPNGTSGAYTTFSAAPGSEGKVIIGKGDGNPAVSFYGDAQWFHFHGIIFDGFREQVGFSGAAWGVEGTCTYNQDRKSVV